MKPQLYVITHHPSIVNWTKEKLDYEGDVKMTQHFQNISPRCGDIVAGQLTCEKAAYLHSKGVLYYHLSVHVPHKLKGKELVSADMVDCAIKLECYTTLPTEEYDRLTKFEKGVHMLLETLSNFNDDMN